MNLGQKLLPLWYWMTLACFKLLQEIPAVASVESQSKECSNHQRCSAYFSGSATKSCQDIYQKYPEHRDNPGYYWVTNYCGMGYKGMCCEEIYTNYPETRDKPGYYHIKDEWVFCNMTAISKHISGHPECLTTCAGVGGGWSRIAHFDISAGDNCPSGWTKDKQSGISFCRPPGNNPAGYMCYSTNFSTNGMSYNSVCGRARGYQKGDVWGFWGSTTTQGKTIDGSYVDGLSITHGAAPRHHIWTYAVGQFDHSSTKWGCPCSPYKATTPPYYIKNNYYCESGATKNPYPSTYYFTDPLWDGSGCSNKNQCCSKNPQPWFYHNLGYSTTDDIEARICISYATYKYGAVVVDQMELYIQ